MAGVFPYLSHAVTTRINSVSAEPPASTSEPAFDSPLPTISRYITKTQTQTSSSRSSDDVIIILDEEHASTVNKKSSAKRKRKTVKNAMKTEQSDPQTTKSKKRKKASITKTETNDKDDPSTPPASQSIGRILTETELEEYELTLLDRFCDDETSIDDLPSEFRSHYRQWSLVQVQGIPR